MPYATDADLTGRYSIASTASALQRGYALADAAAQIDADAFADRCVRAHCLLALHYLQENGAIAGGEDGAVTARSMGELSISYAGPAEVGPHGSTGWGRKFDEIAAGVLHPLEVG